MAEEFSLLLSTANAFDVQKAIARLAKASLSEGGKGERGILHAVDCLVLRRCHSSHSRWKPAGGCHDGGSWKPCPEHQGTAVRGGG
jgi:hypothetical protein